MLLFLVAGLFESAFHPNVFALIGDTVDDDELSRAFAVVRIGANVGTVIGPRCSARQPPWRRSTPFSW